MAYAETAEDYAAILSRVREEYSEKAHTYLCKLEPARFARFAVTVPRYGHESSNTVESVNGQLCAEREKPIHKLLEGIWDRQMEKITKHIEATRQHATDAPFPFVPRAVTFLADAQEASLNHSGG